MSNWYPTVLCILLGLTNQFVKMTQLLLYQAAVCCLLAQMFDCSKTWVILVHPESSCYRIVYAHSCPLYMHLPGAVLIPFPKAKLLRVFQKRNSYKIITKQAIEDVQTPAAKHSQNEEAEISLEIIKESYGSYGRTCVTYLCPFSNWAGFCSGMPFSSCRG